MPDPFAESFKRMKADDQGLWEAMQKAKERGIPVPHDDYNRDRDEMGFFDPVTGKWVPTREWIASVLSQPEPTVPLEPQFFVSLRDGKTSSTYRHFHYFTTALRRWLAFRGFLRRVLRLKVSPRVEHWILNTVDKILP